ncbi:MAG: PD-(D/E)XK nuclease family protein, partial [Synergistes sp.]|nr:PD-(D/E)XK nuclease family protein [Synergistes sp.]
FIVPSGLERDALTDIICGGEAFFGEKPQVWTIADLFKELQRITGTGVSVIDPPDHNLILRYLVGGFIEEKKNGGINLAPGISHKGFVSVLGENIKELLNEDVTAERLGSVLFGDAENSDEDTSPESVLLTLYERYTDYLEENDLADAAQIATLARKKFNCDAALKFAKSKTFIFAGFLSFTGSQRKLIKELSQISEVLMLQPETGLDKFHDGIKQLGLEYKARPEWSVPLLSLEASSSHLEFESIAREIALWMNETGDFMKLGKLENYGDIGVLVPQQSLSVMEYALSRYKIPYNIQVRGTVAESSIGELPALIRKAYASGWSNRETAVMLSDPLLFNGECKARYNAEKFPQGFEMWCEALNEEASERFKTINALCEDLKNGGTPERILSKWSEFLNGLNVGAAAADIAGENFVLDDEVKNISYALYELDKKIKNNSTGKKKIGPAAELPLFGNDAFSFIEDWSRSATLPIQLPQSRSLTLYAGKPPVLAEHRYWIMTEVDYNSWPGKLRESLLLADVNKKKINDAEEENSENPYLPVLSDEREQQEAIFRRLLATGREGVVIARALIDSSKHEVAESQFVKPLFENSERRGWKKAGETIRRKLSDALPNCGKPWFDEVEVLSCGYAKEQIRPVGYFSEEEEKPTVRISDLDTWSTCPFKYWLQRKASVEKKPEELYDPRKAGTLLHKVWEEAAKAVTSGGNNITWQGFVSENWDRIKKAYYPELDSDRRLALRERDLYEKIYAAAGLQNEIDETDDKKLRERIDTEYLFDDYEVNGVIFKGKTDRIDFWSDGGAVLLDYKSGAGKNHVKELQIPAY